ncbi:hypothetical protein MSAN_00719400 [Mycena sanguinolenta]|uniref:Uncharacterized protein n=1 Tax=Mycena sanguinolenta TaxID=230812 RepID=A0A8H7DF88_9AGAR|nr:hypothetical protein MSAN_00719400 [Mycena sanguinolenta]
MHTLIVVRLPLHWWLQLVSDCFLRPEVTDFSLEKMPVKHIPSPAQHPTTATTTSKSFLGNSAKLHIHTASSLPRFMSGFHQYPHGYSTDEPDASAEDLFQNQEQHFASFIPYPDQLWQAPGPEEGYHFSIDTTAIGPNSGIVNANFTPSAIFIPYSFSATMASTDSSSTCLRGKGSVASSMDHPSGSTYGLPDYEPGPFPFAPYQVYPHAQHMPATISPTSSTERLLSPGYGSQHVSPRTSPPNHLTPPTTPGGSGFTASPSPEIPSSSLLFEQQPKTEERSQPLYTHRDQLQFFKEALSLPSAGVSGPFVPQLMYKPHTNSDRRRYVEEVDMEAPIQFWVENPDECGIPLSDALHSRVRRLLRRDETVFEGRGPSVSIRLEWPGYRQWSRQIPTKDFRSPPGPITRAKLAKNVAKCVQRFIQERHSQPMEDDADAKWRVGPGPNQIKLEDLILVSIHHVSMGSWQPHLRLRRPFLTQRRNA